MTPSHSTRSRPAVARSAELLERPVVVYDAACSFCRSQVERIRRMDRRGALDYVPRQTPGLTERFPALAQGDFETGMRFVAAPTEPDERSPRVFVGADAVYEIARRLPFWSRLAWLYRVPGIHAAARRAYAWVALRRRSLGRRCEDGACDVPPSAGGPTGS